MKIEKLFRFWLKVSAHWILFALILGGKHWEFPYSIQEAWEKQQSILQKTWN
jgi:hypothetical protein